MNNLLESLTNKREVGVYSVCTANPIVIEASLEFAKEKNSIVVIESTANQVNQFGGYTGMKPKDFKNMVESIAEKVGISNNKVILGGDHLGPLTWTDESEEEAMEKACTLVYDYVKAGYLKIHLDTSMRLASDDKTRRLDDRIIAKRSAMLAQSAHRAFMVLKRKKPDAIEPVYIIGSEVPIPGGAQEIEKMIITSPKDFLNTIDIFEEVFDEFDVSNIFDRVIAIVVQPGVEYGDTQIDHYNRDKAKDLTNTLKTNFERLIFEGHSTDYQTPEHLRQMVEDGIGILKVGPAMTFALREALFSLSLIESELVEKPSNFKQVLTHEMLENPKHWKNYYHGDDKEIKFKIQYSYSDRSRYYLPVSVVDKTLQKMISNLEKKEIPLNLLSQYMPYQYRRVKDRKIRNTPLDLVKDYIKLYLEDYHYATQIQNLK